MYLLAILLFWVTKTWIPAAKIHCSLSCSFYFLHLPAVSHVMPLYAPFEQWPSCSCIGRVFRNHVCVYGEVYKMPPCPLFFRADQIRLTIFRIGYPILITNSLNWLCHVHSPFEQICRSQCEEQVNWDALEKIEQLQKSKDYRFSIQTRGHWKPNCWHGPRQSGGPWFSRSSPIPIGSSFTWVKCLPSRFCTSKQHYFIEVLVSYLLLQHSIQCSSTLVGIM